MFHPIRNLIAVMISFSTITPQLSAQDTPTWKWYEVRENQVQVHLHVFWSATCPHCAKAHEFLNELQKRYDWLRVFSYEVTGSTANMDMYRQMAQSLGRPAGQVPAFFYCKQMDIGFVNAETTGKRLETLLIYYRDALQKQIDQRRAVPPAAAIPILLLTLPEEAPSIPFDDLVLELPTPPLPAEETVELPWWGNVKASAVSLPALTIILGALDSFNPCAFFVLLILLGLMMHTGSRQRMLIVGSVFVFISGLVYFMFMAAWLNLFFWVGHLRTITLVAGFVALVAAIINIKDYFWFKAGVSLSISDSTRSRLVQKMIRVVQQNGLVALIGGTAGLAFAANLYELLCTAGFPLIYTRVLTLRDLPEWAYYGYLALYNVVYVIPLFLIVVVFSVTLSSHKLTEYQGRTLKLASGLMMLALGGILVVDPGFLNNLVGAGGLLTATITATAIIVLIDRAFFRPQIHSPTKLA